MTRTFLEIVENIEIQLADFYGYRPTAQAQDFLVLSDNNKNEVLVHQDLKGSFLLQICIDADVVGVLENNPPAKGLSIKNLNAFLVVIEEVSHFFHLCFFIEQDKGHLQRMDLEWLAEADKFILTVEQIQNLVGSVDTHQIGKLLFNSVAFYGEEQAFYKDIHHISARFWFRLITELEGLPDPFRSPRLRKILRDLQQKNWYQKVKAA